MTGGGSNEAFDVNAGFNAFTITDFIPHSQQATNNDVIEFGAGMFAGFSDLQSRMTQVGHDTVITDAIGDTLTLHHVIATTLTSNDFIT